jgi:hypothetical protein
MYGSRDVGSVALPKHSVDTLECVKMLASVAAFLVIFSAPMYGIAKYEERQARAACEGMLEIGLDGQFICWSAADAK